MGSLYVIGIGNGNYDDLTLKAINILNEVEFIQCDEKIYNNFINDETGNFLRIQADSWGNTGSNGGNVSLNLNDENISGNIIVDSISSLEMNLESTTYEGIINGDNINIIVDKNSSIKLTGDSYIKSINDYSNIDFNGYKLYVNGNSINQVL